MKSMDYFEFGLPIINNIHGDTWDLVSDCCIGINYINNKRDVSIKYQLKMRTNTRGLFEELFVINAFNEKVMHIIKTIL